MSFDSFEAFLRMGGHAPFVWSAYGITLVVLVFNVVHPWLLRRRVIAGHKRAIERESAQLPDRGG